MMHFDDDDKRKPRQGRLPGTLPPPEVSRRLLLEAIAFERDLEAQVLVHRTALKETRESLAMAARRRRAAEDDLAAVTEVADGTK
jgi:hypothetical protein